MPFAGIDIDGRIAEMEKGLNWYEKKVQLFVAFGKAIPGFKQLPLDDQASLVKGNIHCKSFCIFPTFSF